MHRNYRMHPVGCLSVSLYPLYYYRAGLLIHSIYAYTHITRQHAATEEESLLLLLLLSH